MRGRRLSGCQGAVLIRLRHPSSERLINVVATHMQADYGGPKYDEVRWKQLRQIRGQCEVGPTKRPNLIHTTLKPSLSPLESLCGWTNKQWLIVAGDLNIQGEGAVGEALHPVDPAGAPSKGSHEWWWKIGNPAVASIALYDAWAETTSDLDTGITHAGSEEETSQRLDYILTTRRNAQFSSSQDGTPDLCVQHTWIPPEFEGLSDHRPVAADLNLEAPQCNPRLAYKLVPADWGAAGLKGGKEAKKLHREIVHPGSMQWYRLDEGGTYGIALDPAAAALGATFAVYAASDLSTPLQGAYDLGTETMTACDYPSASGEGELVCEEATGQKFVLPKGPLYVRVFAPDRAQSGAYWIAMHKYDCKSQEEACVLLPNAPATYAFPPAGTPLNAEDEAWFRGAIQEQADSGRRQKLRFYVENVQGADWPEPGLTLADAGGVAVLTQLDGQPLIGPAPATSPSGGAMIVIDGQTRTNAEFLLRVRRSDVEKALTVRVGWQTNLVLLGGSGVGAKPATLVCVDETNPESGEDSIDLEVNIDGTGWQKRGSASFDCDNAIHPENWDAGLGVIRYLDSVRIRLIEVDEGPNDVGPAFAPATWPMDIDVTEAVTYDMLWWMWDGGHYRFYFNQGKWRTQ